MSMLKALLIRHGITITDKNLETQGYILARGGVGGAIGQGDVYFLDCANGSDTNTGKSPSKAFATLATAYDALTTNNNDVLFYLPSATSATISTALTWSKNYCHFVSLGAPTNIAQRRGIFNSGNLTSLLTVSGSGNSFQNLYIFQGGATAASGNVVVSGSRNYFSNCHFAGIGHATPAGNANAYSLKLDGAEENLFKDCTIGIDTIKRTAANHHLKITGDVKRNTFDNCMFLSYAEDAGYAMIDIAAGGDRFTFFKNCDFYNFWANFGGTLSELCDIAVTTTHYCLFKNPGLFGIDEIDTGDENGTYVVGPATSAACGIAVTPTT